MRKLKFQKAKSLAQGCACNRQRQYRAQISLCLSPNPEAIQRNVCLYTDSDLCSYMRVYVNMYLYMHLQGTG